MSIFKNKHLVIAMIVAPILAIASYYLVDMAVKEQPQKALPGQVYKLIAQPNCRFSSGACDLENGTFKSTITVMKTVGEQTFTLDANHLLQSASIGFVTSDGSESGPFELMVRDTNDKQWFADLNVPTDTSSTMRVALSVNDAYYFSETTMVSAITKRLLTKTFANRINEF